MTMIPSRSKYGSRKVTVDGITFDSQKEAARYTELRLLQRAGKITGLETQVKYELIPSQKMDGKVIERPVVYIADFVYQQDGKKVVEDVKGYRDPSSAGYAKFVLKRKMMLYFHGIRIREV